jgi:hypothetical protein
MREITAIANEKREKANREHNFALQQLRKRVETASEQLEELRSKNNTEKVRLFAQANEERERQIQKNDTTNRNLFASLHSASEDLSGQIASLLAKAATAEARLFISNPRPINQKQKEARFVKIHSLDEIAQVTFESFFAAIREAPENAQRPIETPPAMSSRNGKRKETPNPARPDSSSRMLTPIELKPRKKMHFTLSPQYA